MHNAYLTPGPSRTEIDASAGPLLLEFGTDWCGHCQSAAPAVTEALMDFPSVRHVKVEDGRGRPRGRSFGVKLWPTLIFLRDGIEWDRVVRPQTSDKIRAALSRIAGDP